MAEEKENAEPKELSSSLKGRFLVGCVVRAKMNKTVTVEVRRKVRHPKYGKFVARTTRYHAHVADVASCPEGSSVEIKEVRPISKTKNWLVTRVL